AIEILVDDMDRERGRERAVLVPAADDKTRIRLRDPVRLVVELRPTPRAHADLHRIALLNLLTDAELVQCRAGILDRRRGPVATDPESDRDRSSPQVVSFGADDPERADQCRSSLELLDRQQSERVAHEHRHAATGTATPQPAEHYRHRDQA